MTVGLGCVKDWSVPSFLVVGPPRTGTSWLHTVLEHHAWLPNPTKETRFFDTHFHRGLHWYQAHYPAPNGFQAVGEVAPTYFASPEARERIAETIPQAKIVCIFRNPVDRVHSLYRVKRAYGLVPWTFEEALYRDPELLESSRYAHHLREWLQRFDPARIMVTFYDDLQEDPQLFVDRLNEFVGIRPFSLKPELREHVHASDRMSHPRNFQRTRRAMAVAEWCKGRRLDRVVAAIKSSPFRRLFLGGGPAFTELDPQHAEKLYDLFRPEVEDFENLVGRDLSSWKSMEAQLLSLESSFARTA